MNQIAQWMERAATVTGSYPLTASVPVGLMVVEGGRYSVAVTSADGSTYTITATRVLGTPQESDKCGNFVLDEAGRRMLVSTAPGIAAADCWSR